MCNIYKFYNKNNELIYIGKTINFDSRIVNHMSEDNWKQTEINKIELAECITKTDMDIYEIYYINKLKPKYNIALVNEDVPTFVLPDLIFKEYKKSNEKIKISKSKNINNVRLLLNEQRMLYMICEYLRYNKNCEIFKDEMTVYIDILDFKNKYDINNKSIYTDTIKFSKSLIKKMKDTGFINTFKHDTINSGIKFYINNCKIKELIDYGKQYEIVEINARNSYASLVYDLIKSGYNEFTIEDFKSKLKIQDQYPEYSNLKQKVINPIIGELNRLLNIDIKLNEIKYKKKVLRIAFVTN